MICHVCPICLAAYGTHTDECPAPRQKPPEPTPEDREERTERKRARAIEAWMRGGPLS